ncbi:MAG: hypothetical protein OXF42_06620 [Candidatus Dadabacteria bacterium]|nr:hypothetical protein [Candidatus Dadabacteria bacterium]
MTADEKYSCKACGNNHFVAPADALDVFRGEGDKLIFVRTEAANCGPEYLCCEECGEGLDIDVSAVLIESNS